jgi:dTDP-4-dehydrorhamnose reductase
MAARPILLTGATGQVGAALRPLLERFGPVAAPARDALDLADPDSIRRAVRRIDPVLIVNAAAHTAVDRAESEADLALAINGSAPGVLAEEARRCGAPLVHFSTDYVFEGTKPRGYVETDRVNPISAYGRSKLAGEQAVQAAGGAWLIFRTSWVYGLTGRNFLLTIRRLAAERPELRIVDDQTGAPTWSQAIAEATVRVLAERWGGARADLGGTSGLYHMTAAGSTTWCRFARAILTESGKTDVKVKAIGTIDYPTPAARPARSVLSNAKFRRTFGFALPHWRDQLRACLASESGGG